MAREMKDTGIPWIGVVPSNWEVRKVKHYYNIQTGFTPDTKKQEYYDDVDGYDWVNISDIQDGKTIFKTKKKISQLYVDLVSPAQILPDSLMYSFKLSVGQTAFAGKPLYSNEAIASFSPSDNVDLHFLRYSSFMIMENAEINIYNARILNRDRINNAYIVFPPLKEQNKIASFLDAECAHIDAVIEQTRSSIEEYKKLKQAVITQAVTKGIRPDRPMKDSGVDWIREIPEAWRVTKLKYFSKIRSGITLGKSYPAGTELFEYPYLRVANVQGSYTDLRDVATIKVTSEEAAKYRLQPGELLMTEGGDRDKLGRGTIWHGEIEPCLHQNHVFALQTNGKDLLAEYVSFLSDSCVGRDYFDVTANQSVHLASTNSTTILNFAIPFPPIEEQREIASYLTAKTKEIEQIVKSKELLLAELESYKKTLIFEYVTGKKEVPA